ncbi:hypothetical protein [Bradyrhizobium sp. STM 3557]|uniref:hypothetical protein n=1 Tax=Bradyrhizobium sp. STM 3557 TaxID=578920 RepID=UPI00388E0158
MFDWIRKRLRPAEADDPYTQFVREFMAECQRQNLVARRYDHETGSFAFAGDDGSQISAFTRNTFGEWLRRDPAGRADLIARFVRSLRETPSHDAFSAETLPDELMPGIRPRALVSNMMIRNWISGGPGDDSRGVAFLPFAADLVVCALRDQADSMSLMTRERLADAGLSIAQAIRLGIANFRARLPAPVFEPLGDGLFGCANLEDHQSALLLLRPGQDYPLPPIHGAPIVTVPGRNVFYLTGTQNPAGVARLLDIASSAAELPHACSPSLLQWNDERWIEEPLADQRLEWRRREILQHQLAADYHEQKQLLDQYHDQQGRDVFVASVMLYRAKVSRATFSVATLPSGTTGTLLPRADRLVFVKPAAGATQKVDDMADVSWPDAISMVGHLFAPVPHLYPPRFRALGFPDAEAWSRLKAVAR